MNPDSIKSLGNLTGEEKHESQKQRRKDAGFGNRRAVGTAISTFKGVFLGENISARAWRNVTREIRFKAMVCNPMTGDASEQKTDQN